MKLSDIIGATKTPTQMEERLFAMYGLERPRNIPTAAKKLIFQMALQLGLTTPDLAPTVEPVGAPRKWVMSLELLALWARIELARMTLPKRTKQTAIYDMVKEQYGYRQSLKTLGNQYASAPRDPFVAIILDAIKYHKMSREEKLTYLRTVSKWER